MRITATFACQRCGVSDTVVTNSLPVTLPANWSGDGVCPVCIAEDTLPMRCCPACLGVSFRRGVLTPSDVAVCSIPCIVRHERLVSAAIDFEVAQIEESMRLALDG